MGCGAGTMTMEEPVLLGSFQSSHADITVTDSNIIVKANNALAKVETVRYDNAYGKKMTKINESPVLVDGLTSGFYKGDAVDINIKHQMYELTQYNKICNGVEFHLTLSPTDGSPTSKLIIGCDDDDRTYNVRYDQPVLPTPPDTPKSRTGSNSFTNSTFSSPRSEPASPYTPKSPYSPNSPYSPKSPYSPASPASRPRRASAPDILSMPNASNSRLAGRRHSVPANFTMAMLGSGNELVPGAMKEEQSQIQQQPPAEQFQPRQLSRRHSVGGATTATNEQLQAQQQTSLEQFHALPKKRRHSSAGTPSESQVQHESRKIHFHDQVPQRRHSLAGIPEGTKGQQARQHPQMM